jgi:hypothetical protein
MAYSRDTEHLSPESDAPAVFHTDDGYLFVLWRGVWTDGDLSFEDQDGQPWDGAFDEPVEGQLVDPHFDPERYNRIIGLLGGTSADGEVDLDVPAANSKINPEM